VANSEVRQKFEALLDNFSEFPAVTEALTEAHGLGMRAGEIAQREEIADLEEQLRDAYAAIERKNL
jgi:hypothetical protein